MDTKILDEISRRAAELLARSPVADVQKNLKAFLSGSLQRLDLVSREELDAQLQVLQRTREKLQQLEARVAELEAKARDPG